MDHEDPLDKVRMEQPGKNGKVLENHWSESRFSDDIQRCIGNVSLSFTDKSSGTSSASGEFVVKIQVLLNHDVEDDAKKDLNYVDEALDAMLAELGESACARRRIHIAVALDKFKNGQGKVISEKWLVNKEGVPKQKIVDQMTWYIEYLQKINAKYQSKFRGLHWTGVGAPLKMYSTDEVQGEEKFGFSYQDEEQEKSNQFFSKLCENQDSSHHAHSTSTKRWMIVLQTKTLPLETRFCTCIWLRSVRC